MIKEVEIYTASGCHGNWLKTRMFFGRHLCSGYVHVIFWDQTHSAFIIAFLVQFTAVSFSHVDKRCDCLPLGTRNRSEVFSYCLKRKQRQVRVMQTVRGHLCNRLVMKLKSSHGLMCLNKHLILRFRLTFDFFVTL